MGSVTIHPGPLEPPAPGSRGSERDPGKAIDVWLARSCTLPGVVLAASLIFSHRAHADDALTVEHALREARSANAQLPLAALGVASAREGLGEAKARRWMQIAVKASLRYAPPSRATAAT